MTRIIAALQRMGMIDRKTNPEDGRQVLVDLTAAGTARADAEGAARERWLAQKLSTMTPEERALLREAAALLNRLAEG